MTGDQPRSDCPEEGFVRLAVQKHFEGLGFETVSRLHADFAFELSETA